MKTSCQLRCANTRPKHESRKPPSVHASIPYSHKRATSQPDSTKSLRSTNTEVRFIAMLRTRLSRITYHVSRIRHTYRWVYCCIESLRRPLQIATKSGRPERSRRHQFPRSSAARSAGGELLPVEGAVPAAVKSEGVVFADRQLVGVVSRKTPPSLVVEMQRGKPVELLQRRSAGGE